LEDNKLYDVKEYEITAKNYFDALGIKQGKPADAEKEAKNV
jgi:hypothetical protein